MSIINLNGVDTISMHEPGDELMLDEMATLMMVKDTTKKDYNLWQFIDNDTGATVQIGAKGMAVILALMLETGFISVELYNAIQRVDEEKAISNIKRKLK